MPAYIKPNQSYAKPKIMRIGIPAYSFGYDNSIANPVGPAAPAAPTLTTGNVGTGNISGNVFVQTQYVYPGSSWATSWSPTVAPSGFGSNVANVAVGANNCVNVASVSASPDFGNIAIGYNVFAGTSNVNLVLQNTQAVVPIGTAFTISNQAALTAPTGGCSTTVSSPTPTFNFEAVGAIANATAGMQFAVPVSSAQYVGDKNLTWNTVFANGAPASSNIALQAAYVDNPNSYVTIDYSTNTSGEFRSIAVNNYQFIRAYLTTLVGNSQVAVSFRVG